MAFCFAKKKSCVLPTYSRSNAFENFSASTLKSPPIMEKCDIDIDILFMFHESTITINRIQNMSRVIRCINVWNQNKLIPCQVHEWCLIDRTKPLCNNKSTKDMAIVNKQRKVKYRQHMNTDSKFMHMNNINITMFFFLWDLEIKHRIRTMY